MTRTEYAIRYRAMNDAYARIRAGVATDQDRKSVEAFEAIPNPFVVGIRPRTIYDLPIAKTMWEQDARQVER